MKKSSFFFKYIEIKHDFQDYGLDQKIVQFDI
jgi:hypothetical protein